VTRRYRYSLWARLLLASLVTLPLFLGGTGWYLERSYQRSLESATEERLHLQVLTLMAEAEYNAALSMPEALLESRFNQVNSGLFGLISAPDGNVLWRSRSAIAISAAAFPEGGQPIRAGERGFSASADFYHAWYAVLWQTENGDEVPLVFSVLETTAPTMAQLATLRSSLLLWLGATTLVLLALQVAVLVWGLRPLRELASDIALIEAGEGNRLDGDYPREVQPVTDNLNSLLQAEQQRRERTRNTLGDLAHSLKTPLAVIRSADSGQPEFAALVSEQSDRMEQIIDYQLQRASGAGHSLLRLIPLLPVATRLRDTLAKVYAGKSLDIQLAVPANARFRGDERDLMELLGNLMENACKYGRETIQVTATGDGDDLEIAIEDDGPGIPPEARDTLLARGARADQTQPGQGIGLAVAADIAASYGARLDIGVSDLGGARITIGF
jgi:two-component system sensor histidine kinase PhoQ